MYHTFGLGRACRHRLRSSTDRSCAVPRTHCTFGDRSFAVARPRVWYCLPANLRDEDITYTSFRREFKTYCFFCGRGATSSVRISTTCVQTVLQARSVFHHSTLCADPLNFIPPQCAVVAHSRPCFDLISCLSVLAAYPRSCSALGSSSQVQVCFSLTAGEAQRRSFCELICVSTERSEVKCCIVGVCDVQRHRIRPFDVAVPGRGRVELRGSDGQWGLVCDDVWNDLAAQVFCTCLGYQRFAYTCQLTVDSRG